MTGIIYSHAISPILVAILIIIIACCRPRIKESQAFIIFTMGSYLFSIIEFGIFSTND